VRHCSKLRTLSALPCTLRELLCDGCWILQEIPNSLSSTAVSRLNFGHCHKLATLPELPRCLLELEMSHSSLQQVPALPEGLKQLDVSWCTELTEVSMCCLSAVSGRMQQQAEFQCGSVTMQCSKSIIVY
jgi:hypothetical protein